MPKDLRNLSTMFCTFLYILKPKKNCTFHLGALCVRARTTNGLEMHVIFSLQFLKYFLYRGNQIMFTAFPIKNLYCTSVKRPTSIKRPLNRGRTVTLRLKKVLSGLISADQCAYVRRKEHLRCSTDHG